MINKLLMDNDIYIDIITEKRYKEYAKKNRKQIKGKSRYEDYYIVSELPRKKEFYVIVDEYYSYPTGGDDYVFSIAIRFKGLYFVITDRGGN